MDSSPVSPFPQPGAAAQRRALVRHYKDNPPPMGVYAIRCDAQQLVCVKASTNLPGAFNRERFQLRLGGHPDRRLQQAWRVHGEAALRFEVLDANQPLPFPDGAFDGVVSLSTLQYVLDPEQLLREAARVLRPGGHLLVEVPNLAYLPQRLRLAAGRPPRTSYWRHGIDGGNLHYFTGDLLESLVRGAGLLPRRLTGSGVFAPLRTWWVRLLCGNLFVLAEKPRP